MNLKNYYYYFQSALPPRLVDDILAYGKQHQAEMAVTGGVTNKVNSGQKLSQKDIKNIQKKRNSDIVWMNDRWIYKEVQPYLNQANEAAGWNFQWDWSETVQFTTYSSGGFYSFHQDSWPKPYPNTHQNPSFRGKIRKLSVTVTLSDPWEYEGGRLEFGFTNFREKEKTKIQQCTEILDKGSLVVFPSFVWHRVTPVTKGFRQSLVMWNLGHPWK